MLKKENALTQYVDDYKKIIATILNRPLIMDTFNTQLLLLLKHRNYSALLIKEIPLSIYINYETNLVTLNKPIKNAIEIVLSEKTKNKQQNDYSYAYNASKKMEISIHNNKLYDLIAYQSFSIKNKEEDRQFMIKFEKTLKGTLIDLIQFKFKDSLQNNIDAQTMIINILKNSDHTTILNESYQKLVVDEIKQDHPLDTEIIKKITHVFNQKDLYELLITPDINLKHYVQLLDNIPYSDSNLFYEKIVHHLSEKFKNIDFVNSFLLVYSQVEPIMRNKYILEALHRSNLKIVYSYEKINNFDYYLIQHRVDMYMAISNKKVNINKLLPVMKGLSSIVKEVNIYTNIEKEQLLEKINLIKIFYPLLNDIQINVIQLDSVHILSARNDSILIQY